MAEAEKENLLIDRDVLMKFLSTADKKDLEELMRLEREFREAYEKSEMKRELNKKPEVSN